MRSLVKLVAILVFSILFSSCTRKELSSDMFLEPLKKMKEEDKKQGRPAPNFDGFTEPEFPSEDENAKSFKGVDSNHDGIRDDLEIWINRMAEDGYVRASMKDYYRRYVTQLEDSFIDKSSDQIQKDILLTQDSFSCLETSLQPRMMDFYKKTGKRIANERVNMMMTILINTEIRQKFVKKMTAFQTSSEIASTKKSSAKYCTALLGEYYSETLKRFPLLDDSQLPKLNLNPGR